MENPSIKKLAGAALAVIALSGYAFGHADAFAPLTHQVASTVSIYSVESQREAQEKAKENAAAKAKKTNLDLHAAKQDSLVKSHDEALHSERQADLTKAHSEQVQKLADERAHNIAVKDRSAELVKAKDEKLHAEKQHELQVEASKKAKKP